jgi:DNA-binding transcriptional ArsR family regulator
MDAKRKRLYELKAGVIQAVAQPVRLAIIEFLRDGEQCVCDIAAHVGAERSNVSRHLSLMLKAGVLESRKDGLRMMYTLRTPCVLGFLECVSEVLRERFQSDRAVLGRL